MREADSSLAVDYTLWLFHTQYLVCTYVYLEPFHGAVVGVHHELGEGGQLGGAVPAITTVHQHIDQLQFHTPSYHSCTLWQAYYVNITSLIKN